jgi:hypothetical protein
MRRIGGVRSDVREAIHASLDNCVTETFLDIGGNVTVVWFTFSVFLVQSTSVVIHKLIKLCMAFTVNIVLIGHYACREK